MSRAPRTSLRAPLAPTERHKASRPVPIPERVPAPLRVPDCSRSPALEPVVGLVASAGALDAARQFFRTVPQASGMAFVLVAHLDPHHESLLPDLIGAETPIPVLEAIDGMRVEADHAYVIPPDHSLVVRAGLLCLTQPLPEGALTPIDGFLEALADEYGASAICVLLSGSGGFGTPGARAVKAVGGMVLVQEPASARQPSMPESAIAAGLADMVLPPEAMYAALAERLRERGHLPHGQGLDPEALRPVLGLLHARAGFDFAWYRKPMIARRILRRQQALGIDSLEGYVAHLDGHAEERSALVRDLLIGVTAFFRDPQAFDALETEVVPELIASSSADDPLRVWVPGCSSGEEAYSLAIVLLDALESAGLERGLQVFATDVDEDAIARARLGTYDAASIAHVGPARLARHFVALDHGRWQVSGRLRDLVVFAAHNVLEDPPFSRLDLISCRNLLIYLEPVAQETLMRCFHQVLRPRGFLFLGASESAGRPPRLFAALDKKWRLYRKREHAAARQALPTLMRGMPNVAPRAAPAQPAGPRWRAASVEVLAQQALLREFAPAAAVVNDADEVLYFSGNTGRYLRQPSGKPTHNLFALAPAPLRGRLRKLMQESRSVPGQVSVAAVRQRRGRGTVDVLLTARGLARARSPEGLILVTFEDQPASAGEVPPQGDAGAHEALMHRLEHELNASQHDLRSTVEELESSNEELKAANEEVIATNEELQSANEELETSREELQSLNEELSALNAQLLEKMGQLEQANDDMSNLLLGSGSIVLFADAECRLRRFTPAAARLLELERTDIGRPLERVLARIDASELCRNAESVLHEGRALENHLRDRDGHWYLARLTPYLTSGDDTSGLVLTLLDVDALKRAELELAAANRELESRVAERTRALEHENQARQRAEGAMRAERDFAATVVQSSSALITVTTSDGRIVRFNPACEAMSGYRGDEVLGKRFADLDLLIPEESAKVFECVAEAVQTKRPSHGLNQWRNRLDGSLREIAWTNAPLTDATGQVTHVVTTGIDVTAQRRAAAELRDEHALLDTILSTASALIMVLDRDLRMVRLNDAAAQAAGYTVAELAERSILDLALPDEDFEAFRSSLRRARDEGQPQSFETGWQRRDGARRIMSWTVSSSPDTGGESFWVIATALDITARRRAEVDALRRREELSRLHRLHTAGELAQLLAHELNQPLAAIAGYVQSTLIALEGITGVPRPVLENVRRITEQVQRAGRFIGQLHRLVAQSDPAARPMALGPVIGQACELVTPFAQRHDIRLECNLPPVIPEVIGVDVQIEHVLLNLLRNAIESIRDSGTVGGMVRIEVVLHSREEVCVTVTDTGPGVAPSQSSRIFDPFVSTKAEGLGLGLRISRSIIESLGGRLWVEPGSQGCFRFTLPLA